MKFWSFVRSLAFVALFAVLAAACGRAELPIDGGSSEGASSSFGASGFSASGYGGSTPHGIRIGPVFTPPELRGQGYATSLVAEQSRWLLGTGRSLCFLYTDLDNPTSNALYRRIGYRMIAEAKEVRFDPRGAA